MKRNTAVAQNLFHHGPEGSLSRDDFEYLRSAICSLTGIALSDRKIQLVQTRLRSRLQDLNLKDAREYRQMLQRLPPSHPEWQKFTNCLTTNKTDWFREPSHFTFLLDTFIPHWLSLSNQVACKKTLKVWSAACSTGEEPYTLSILLNQLCERRRLGSYEILATDIDTQVLQRASNGIYFKSALSQVPKDFHKSAFVSGTQEISHLTKVRPHLKEKISFHHYNLTQPRCPWHQEFDVIFCRNVFIYFTKDTISRVLDSFFEAAAKDAILFLGHSESIQCQSKWRYVKPSIYVKGNGL